MENFLSVRNKVIVVIGGCGNLGAIINKHFMDNGSKVVCVDKVTPDEVSHPTNSDGFYQCDITDEAAVKACLADVQKNFGMPDGVMITAALDSPPDAKGIENGPLETSPIKQFAHIIDVNLTGSFIVSKVFGSAMAEAGKGSIVLFNSIYGVVAPRQDIYKYRKKDGDVFFKPPAYSVSKSGLSNLNQYLATYWGKAGIRVNEVILGGVFNHQDSAFVDAYSANVPMGRMANPEEILGALTLLMSDASSYMTGSSITIDGGYTAW